MNYFNTNISCFKLPLNTNTNNRVFNPKPGSLHCLLYTRVTYVMMTFTLPKTFVILNTQLGK